MSKFEIVMKVPISKNMAEQIREAARRNSVETGFLVRKALRFYLRDNSTSTEAEAAHLLEEICQVLAKAVKQSHTWAELQEEIAKSNFELAPKGGGLCVRKKDTKAEICKASDAGFPFQTDPIFRQTLPGPPAPVAR
jgi:hypothetical protein